MKKYNVIYADPCWSFNNKNTGGSMVSGADAHYDTLSVEQLCGLPIKNITDDNCVLFMWWVGSQPMEALEVMTSWGFTLKTMTGFVWVKTTKHDKMDFGMGFWTRQGSENCLIAVKGKPRRIDAGLRAVREVEWPDDTCYATNEKHSKKPDCFRNRIVELMGDKPRVELFARQSSIGWDVWGNEVNNSINLLGSSGQ